MRQNPVTSRIQVGGRQMPSWFSTSLVQNEGSSRRPSNALPPPPPLPPGPPPQDESEYEEIDHLPRYTNTNARNNPAAAAKRSCSLCGNSSPVVRCEMCNNQIFCGSCNDMYHRHPKRHNHIRKLLEPPFDNPNRGPKCDAPIPPPRRLKKMGIRSATSSPTTTRKMFFGGDPFGSLRRGSGMEQRPLPPPPTQVPAGPPLPPKNSSMTVNNQQQFQRQPAGFSSQRNIPVTVLELTNQQRSNFVNNHSNFSSTDGHGLSSADSAMRGRAQSISSCQLDRFNNSSSNLSHIATLQRKPRRPIICGPPRPPPPPIPPREYPQHQQQQQQRHQPHRSVHSASAFNLNQLPMDDDPQFDDMNSPWSRSQFSHPTTFQSLHQHHQQQQQQQQQQRQYPFYPGNSNSLMKRTPSSSSMTSGSMQPQHQHPQNQPIFNPWSTIRLAQSQSMTASERELEMISNARRGSEPPPPPLPPYGNQTMNHDHRHQHQQQMRSTVSHLDMMRPLNHRQPYHNRTDNEFQSDEDRSSSPRPMMMNHHQQQQQLHHRDSFSSRGTDNGNNNVNRHLHRSNSKKSSGGDRSESPDFWQCEWCTLINTKEKNICTVCCKTRTNHHTSTNNSNRNSSRSPAQFDDSIELLDHRSSEPDPPPPVQSKLKPSSAGTAAMTRTSPKKQQNSFIRSTLTFTRSDKDKTSAHVEKQIIKVEASEEEGEDEDDENENDPSLSPSSEEEEEEEEEVVVVTSSRDGRDNRRHHQQQRPERKKNVNKKSKTPLTSSNEEVYGSVPLQTLTISPKPMDFPEQAKRKISTGVGSSPPGSLSAAATSASTSATGGTVASSYLGVGHTSLVDHHQDSGERRGGGGESLSKKSSQSPDSKSFKASHVIELKKMTSTAQASTASSASSVSASTSTSTTSTTTAESFTEPFEIKLKSSKGTSPPPQSISTQTYDELPASKMGSKSTSRSSILGAVVDPLEDRSMGGSGGGGGGGSGRTVKEMSDKELRYTRKAQQQSKLKRSMSTHLTSAPSTDPWMIEANEGRHLYRSSSRHSLASDTRSLPLSGPPSREASPPRGRFYQDFRSFGPPSWDRFPSPADYFASIDDLVNNRYRKDSGLGSSRFQEFELTKLLKDAGELNFTPEDVQVALRMCGERNPIKWLQDNWGNMVETVQTLATKYGREKGEEKNEVGTISIVEAREALRLHKGNVWLSVTDCVEQRRKKFLELQARGNFLREDILTALTANHGKLDSAYVELSKAQLKPFLMQMQIWGPPMGADNESAPSYLPSSSSLHHPPSSSSSSSSAGSGGEKSFAKIDIPHGIYPTTEFPQNKLQENLSLIDPAAAAEVAAAEVAAGSCDGSGTEANVKLTSPISATGAVAAAAEKEETILLPTTLPLQIEPNDEVDLHSLQNKRSSLEADEQFMDATEGMLAGTGTPDYFLNKDTVTPDPEESEAFVSDLLQNFQVEAGNQVSLEPSASLAPAAAAATTSQQKNESSSSELNADSTRTMKSPSLQTKLVTLPGIGGDTGGGSEMLVDIQVGGGTTATATNSETTTVVQSKLHFSMEAVLELLDQQRIKLLREQQQHMNKEIELEQKIKETNPNSLAIQQQQQQQEPEQGQSGNGGWIDEKSSQLDKPKIPTSPLTSNQKDAASLVAPTQNGGEEQLPPGNKRGQGQGPIFGLPRQTSRESGPNDDNDISIYEEVDNGEDNFNSVVEYLSQIQKQQHQNDGESEEEGEEEGEEDEEPSIRDDDPDISIDDSEGSIETHSELSGDEIDDDEENDEEEEEEEDEMVEETYEKIELVQDTRHKSNIENDHPKEQQQQQKQRVSKKGIKGKEISVPIDAAAADASTNSQATAEKERQKIEPVKEVKPEIKRLMDSGLSDSFEHAERAVQLMDMKFTEEDSVYAAKECASIYAALSYLQQDCLLCAGKFSATQMISMLRCTHWCCKGCAKDYFIVQLRDHGILDATCPFCKEPSNLLEDPEVAAEYFNHLDILLKNLLDDKHHEMFQRKLRDWTLAKTPNFKWCSKCSSGFITEPLQTRLVCPDCSAVTCAVCLEPWDRTHDHRDQTFIRLCDSDATKSIVDYLNENCIECPRCRLKFALARGGCMHLTCSQCRFEFCSGCSAPFRQSTKCTEGPFCHKLGLHAHHPRNCLFYLRDKEPAYLAELLEQNAIPYLSEEARGAGSTNHETEVRRICRVAIQKETEAGLQDDVCGNDAPPGFATVCQAHYIEYLGLLIWQNHLDPISILSNDDLETIIKRARGHHKFPGRAYGTKDADYRLQLLQVINDEIPL